MEDIKSPFVQYDLNAHRDNTTRLAIRDIYKVLGDNADLLIFTTKDKLETIQENHSKVAQKVMEVIVKNNVPDCDMQLLITNFQSTLFQIFDAITRQKNDVEKEFMARSIGTRNPANNRYSREYATLGDLFTALTLKRSEQGNKKEDYEFDAPTNEAADSGTD